MQVGDTSGELTVIQTGIVKGPKGNRRQYVVCRCSCGREIEYLATVIAQRKISHCKSSAHAYRIVGNRRGSLVVTDANYGTNERGRRLIRCRCDCGGEIVLTARAWSQGGRLDCGCTSHRNRRHNHVASVGDVFGHLTVLSTSREMHGTSQVDMAHCRCSCGKEVDVTVSNLGLGKVRSCGCYGRVANGDVFGRLTVIDNSLTSEKGISLARCRCSCDAHNEIVVPQTSLKRGNTKSCGCLVAEHTAHMTKHGGARTRLYKIWKGVRDRTLHSNRSCSKWYADRGVRMAEEWNVWENFRDWAMSHGYDETLTIDRIDSSGDYSPENCRWATRKEQSNNKSDNHRITYNGVTRNVTEWAEVVGMKADNLFNRLRIGWSVEEALTTPEGQMRGWRKRLGKTTVDT